MNRYIQLNKSASYWDIVEIVDSPPKRVVRQMERGEMCGTPVCRVHRHSEGRANLAKIMALPDLLAALKRLRDATCPVQPFGLLGAEPLKELELARIAADLAIAKAEAREHVE